MKTEASLNTTSLFRLVTAVQELSLARDLDTVMRIVRTVARQITGADGATFVLRDNGYCYYADEDAIGPLWKGSRFPMESCVSGWAMLHKKPAVIADIYVDPRIPVDAYQPTFVKSMVMVPIRTLEPVGAIGNYWASSHVPTEEEVALLQSLADITAVTMENIRVYAELEQRVRERTMQLEEKNREVTDSINYAQHLQQAILPPLSHLSQYFPESFVLYKPKDIVAGDFYWLTTVRPPSSADEWVLLAAADCTGHGVPGAMISVICSNALNRAVKESGLTAPGEILTRTRELVLETFEKSEKQVADGMDISLCAVNLSTSEVMWSGANSPLWFSTDGTIEEIKPHKEPVGQTREYSPFPTHSIQLKKGAALYLMTDGFADQFGGPRGKKFKWKQLSDKLESMFSQPMQAQQKELEQTILQWKGDLEQVDDILIIGIRL